MAPRILIFSIAMGSNYSFKVKNIEIWAPAFFKHNNSFIATVNSNPFSAEKCAIIRLDFLDRKTPFTAKPFPFCRDPVFITWNPVFIAGISFSTLFIQMIFSKVMHVQAFLDFRGFEFRHFQFNVVYNSILFSSPSVLLRNLNLRGFRFPHFFFMCPHVNSVNRGMPVVQIQ